ncbi:MAG: histidine--tRNA ligase [Nitriliruptoraceae bacterium]
MATIDANPASGTRDYLPEDLARRDAAFGTIKRVFRQHGFDPLDTPAFERLEVLTGKYGDEGDQLIFKILRRGEHAATGQADLALRYDLTVPLARVAARYGSQLPQPFKRYQIAPVWRADRPGKGRFREFYQCDLDVVGSASLIADATTIVALTDALHALGIEGYRVQVNHRRALAGLVEAFGIPVALATETLVALDKLDKIGVERVGTELAERGIPAAAAAQLVAALRRDDAVDVLRERLSTTTQGAEGLAEVDRLLTLIGSVAGGTVTFSPVLARGLSYYTGPVFEVIHDELDVTIAAGGRYDGLIGMFQSQDVAATGGSLGLERIMLLLEAQGNHVSVGPQVVATVVDDIHAATTMEIAQSLRGAGVTVDVYAGSGKLGKQLKYADRRRAKIALIVGQQEAADGTVTLKDLVSGQQSTVTQDDVVPHVLRLVETIDGLGK